MPATPAIGWTTCGCARAIVVVGAAVLVLGAEVVSWFAATLEPQPAIASAVIAVAARSRIV